MRSPQRIRSRVIILIYPKFNQPTLIIQHLRTVLKIQSEDEWTYITKLENLVSGQTNTIVYIECKFDIDLYVSKLKLEQEGVTTTPSAYCWSEKEFLFRYMFTFYEKQEISEYILTNMQISDIEKEAIFIKIKETNISYQTPSPSPSSEEFSNPPDQQIFPQLSFTSSNNKPVIKEKQIQKFMTYLEDFNITLSSSPNSRATVKELGRLLQNMMNYRSTYQIPKELEKHIKDCQLKLRVLKSSQQ